ncbi:hypothetical protein Q5692_24200 [Microcoleus sp. C2C3]|uniref:hypothetical protein n=1 Tax=unclassified Microcoleus TaxID=2642155 RepID=UPI002FCEAD44
MSQKNDCAAQPQFLTRESLFDSRAARIHVFDSITHDKAFEILCEVMPDECQWAKYFGLRVMTVNDVAAYYGLKTKHLKHTIGSDGPVLGELIEGGLLVMRDKALEGACSKLNLPPSKELLLLPPQAVIRLCLFLPALPAVVRTFNALWDYIVSKGLDESTLSDWESTVYRFTAIHCDRIGADRELAARLKAEAKTLNLYPYVQHFGVQDCLESWFALLAHKGEFPPPRGNYYIRKHQWADRISDVCLRE